MSLTKSIGSGVDTQGQLGEKAAEFKKIFRDEVLAGPFMNLHGCILCLYVRVDLCVHTQMKKGMDTHFGNNPKQPPK